MGQDVILPDWVGYLDTAKELRVDVRELVPVNCPPIWWWGRMAMKLGEARALAQKMHREQQEQHQASQLPSQSGGVMRRH